MPPKTKPSEVFRETFIVQVPPWVQPHLRILGGHFYLHSIELQNQYPYLDSPWNRTLLKAVLVDLEWLIGHIIETFEPEDPGQGWREQRLARVVGRILPKLKAIVEELRHALRK